MRFKLSKGAACALLLAALFATALLPLGGCSDSSAGNGPAPAAAALPDDDTLRKEVDEVLDFTEMRYLSSDEHAAWQIMHGILAYGRGLHIYHDGKLVPALDWILQGGNMKGWHLRPGDHGLDTVMEPGSKTGQGHEDQWLAVLSQCDLQWDDPIVWDGKTYKIGDLVQQAQSDIREGQECSWTIIGLTTYLPLDAQWEASDGKQWNIEKVVEMEADQDLNSSACGGSHRLIGMTMAVNRHLAANGKLDGGWAKAEGRIQDAIKTIQEYQQPDGSFSTNYLARPGTTPDVAKRIGTSGHTLEFLTLALKPEQLKEPWVTRAVMHLCKLLRQTRKLPVECGALYHAVHALQIYRLRRFGPQTLEDDAPAKHAAAAPASPHSASNE